MKWSQLHEYWVVRLNLFVFVQNAFCSYRELNYPVVLIILGWMTH